MVKKIAQKLAILIIEAMVPKLLEKLEEIIDKDLNKDGKIGNSGNSL